MANTPAVSVIIPMYNAEKYISECLESIFAQTLQDFEVIVVDDCSTDDGVKIVERYLPKLGGRLKLFGMEKNSGGGALPRNKGLVLSRGEYIFFVDADDLITPTALAELYNAAKNFSADVVYCEKMFETDSDAKNVWLINMQNGVLVDKPTLETENLSGRVHEILKIKFGMETVLKFVRRDFLLENEIFFPHIKPSEDSIWTYGLIFFAKRFLRVPNAVYIRRLSNDSVMRTERTPQENIIFWINSVVAGMKSLDKFMSKLEFFQQNISYRYAMLEHFVHLVLGDLFESSLQVAPSSIYEAIRRDCGKNFGEHEILISFLLADLIEQQKNFVQLKNK